MKSARHIFFACLVAMFPVAWECASAQSDQPSGEITLAAYASYYQDNFTKAVVEPFMRQFPNITVNYFAQRSSAERLGTLRAQKGDPQIDVAIMDVSVARAGNFEGLFAPIDPAKVPNLAELSPNAKVAGDYGPALTFDSLALIYNRDQFNEPPKSWRAMWDARAKRKVVINAPPNIQGLALTIIATKMEGGDYKKSIEPGLALLTTLAPDVQSWSPSPDAYTLVTNGTAALGTGWNSFSQLYRLQSGGKMGVVIPMEGTVQQIDTINLVAGAKNSAAAQVFINYALSSEAQAALMKILHFSPANSKTSGAPEDAALTAPPSAAIDADWGYVAEVRDRWLERWRREVIGGR
ncbi:ABC transporter substrate-binding protein [Microvirga sp. VF16]|uniref:ABC transporter substrate-binding protein n=1 Tax=Microvirga sp. VF16 TaxID=2807101 RepID=UPI00193DFD25|nr:ABC transporter substrate-binding protein [Microvirga sp. VF16]QRM33059.1 ABC transporter substrate-binding protein [Microvirga sp. VF16]